MGKKFETFRDEYRAATLELYKKAHKLKLNEDGDISLSGIIGLAVGLIVLAAVAPTAIGAFYQVNTSAWQIDGVEDAKTTALFWLLPFMAVIVFLYMIYKRIEGN